MPFKRLSKRHESSLPKAFKRGLIAVQIKQRSEEYQPHSFYYARWGLNKDYPLMFSFFVAIESGIFRENSSNYNVLKNFLKSLRGVSFIFRYI